MESVMKISQTNDESISLVKLSQLVSLDQLLNTGVEPYTACNLIDTIESTISSAEEHINEMLSMLTDFQRGENQKYVRHNSDLEIDRPTSSNHKRRKQILGDMLDSEVVTTRVDVVIKSDSTRYCILSVLKGHFLFSQLNESELENVIDSMQNYFANEGEIIIEQGSPGDVFYILESGACDIIVDGKSVQRLEDPASFGDLALMYNCPRNATVVALTDSFLWTLDRVFFRQAMVASSSNQNIQLSQFLSKIALFQNLSDQTLNQLARSLSKQTFQDGEYIIKQNEIGDRFYVIGRGCVKVTANTNNGEIDLTTLHEGEIFGERALIKKEARKANCISQGICECYYLNKQDFSSILGEIFDKLIELDEIRSLKTIQMFNKLSINRIMHIKKQIRFETFFYGQEIKCDSEVVFIVLEGLLEALSGNTYGSLSTIGNVKMTSDKVETTLKVISKESKVGIVQHELLQQYILSQRDYMSNEDNIELELDHEVHDELNSTETPKAITKKTALTICKRLEDVEVVTPLGKGSFGNVYLGMSKINGMKIALKCLDKQALVESSQHLYVQREIIALQSFDHVFIGNYYGFLVSRRKIILLLEYLSGGELWSYLYNSNLNEKGNAGGLSLHQTALYSAMVMLALQHIHEQGFCYRDLKPENLLITSNGYLKLIDFGFAKAVPFVNKSQSVQYRTFTLCGTPEMMAPEIVLTQGHDKSVDCWAFGILIFELLCGYTPFEGRNQQRTFEKIVHSQKYLTFPNGFDPHAKSLIRKLLHPNPALRFGALQNGFNDVRLHAFFATQNVDYERLLREDIVMTYKPLDSDGVSHGVDVDMFDLNEEIYGTGETDYEDYFANLSNDIQFQNL